MIGSAFLTSIANQTTGQVTGGGTSNIFDQQQPNDANTANGNLYNRNQRFGSCFQAQITGSPLTFTVSFAKGSQTPNGTLTGEIWPTSGNVASHTCISGVGAILASTNSINGVTVVASSYATFTFNFGALTLTKGTFYLLDVFYTGCPPGGCNMINQGIVLSSDASHDLVLSGCDPAGWGGTCGQTEFSCLGVDQGCPSYILTTNPYKTGGGSNNVTATPGLPSLSLTLPLFAVGAVGLVAFQVMDRRKHGDGTL